MSQAILGLDVEFELALHQVDLLARESRTTEQQAREALAHSPIYSHHKLNVELAGDALILQGRVESFYYKQMAQEVVRNICRGMQLINEIAVD